MKICVPFNNTLFYDGTGDYFNSTIRFFPVQILPIVFYNRFTDPIGTQVYQICGPFILMLSNLALKMNAR